MDSWAASRAGRRARPSAPYVGMLFLEKVVVGYSLMGAEGDPS